MRMSEKLDSLFLALNNFRVECPSLVKDCTAEVPTKNGGRYTYHYADLGTIVDQVAPLLRKHGLTVHQSPGFVEGKPCLVTILSHTGGQFIQGELPLPASDDPQDVGASITYYRRYALVTMLGLVTEEDDDARNVKPKSQPAQRQSAPPPAAATHAGQAKCALCKTVLILSKSGSGYYCPNFQSGGGEHTRFPKDRLADYIADQNQRAFEDDHPQ